MACEKDEIIRTLEDKLISANRDCERLRKAKLTISAVILRDEAAHGTVLNILSAQETEKGLIVMVSK
jgi:hypothetical protein